jgi:hypothetical protein
MLHIPRNMLNAKLNGDPAFAARLYRAVAMCCSTRWRSPETGLIAW